MSKREDAIRNVTGLRRAARAAGAVESLIVKAAKPLSSKGFPYRKPNVPRGVVVPREPSTLGANFETDWARKYPARVGRAILTQAQCATRRRGATRTVYSRRQL